ncbi:hypothetical protein Btru_008914 [Bulinus truncatus]|nr:hypothetical protein Btru_008914 [Bulinus truncatus]
MVRVVSQNFSPPRSRHSSGDTDRDLAERTNLALSSLGRKKCDLPEYESSSDSFWDSELDGEHYDTVVSESGENNDINGNEKSDVQSKRRERRRERNKLSAQAYRMRRRTQNVKEQQELMHLEAENKRLHKLVEALEKKREDARLRLRSCSVPEPLGAVGGILQPHSSTHKEIAHTSLNKNVGLNLTVHSAHQDHAAYPPVNPSSVFSPALPHPSQISFREPENPILIPMNNNAPAHATFCPTNQKISCSLSQPAHFIINANAFKSTVLVPDGPKQFSAAFFAIPVEDSEHCLNANLNCKPVKTSFPKSNPTEPPCTEPDDLCSATLKNEAISAPWWRAHGNQVLGSGQTFPGAVYSDQTEMCNNDNMNNANIKSNANDPNGNCDKKSLMQQFSANSPLSFNMNHIAETSQQTGPEEIGQHKMRHPKKQYHDQFMPVSVK